MRVARFVLYVAFIFFDPPGWWRMAAILTSIRPPFDAYILPCPSIVGRRFRIAPLTTNDRCGFRVDRLRPAIPFRFLHDTSTPLRCRSVPTRPLRSVTARGAPLHLRLQTIFTLPFPLYPRHLRLCLRRRVRSRSSVPRNLRLLFRPVRTGIRTPSSNRRTASIRHHPPTHKRTDERTAISPWHSLHLSPRAGM